MGSMAWTGPFLISSRSECRAISSTIESFLVASHSPATVHVQVLASSHLTFETSRVCRIQTQIESNSHFAHLIHKAGADEGALEADEDYGLG